MMQAFQLPPYLPDQTPNSGTMVGLANAYPITDGYAPVGEFQEISTALPAKFLGGGAFVSTSGASFTLVGTATTLSRYASGGWVDLLTGLSVTDQWRFVSFGNFVIAVNGSQTYQIDLVAGTAAPLANAPVGKSVAVVEPYVVIGQTTNDLLSVFTSDVNDHTRWIPDAGATQQPMLTGDEVMGIAGGEYGVILQRRRLVRMTPTGDADLPFEYDQITDNLGCASRGSIAQHGRSVFFLSDQGFMGFEDGQVPVPIGTEQVDRTFQSIVAAADYERIFSAVDPVRKLVIWCVPGSPGSLWIYNYELQKWGIAQLNMEGIFDAFTSSETLEGLAVTYPTLDAVPFSLDDPRFKGGSPQLYVVQGGKMGTLSGPALEAVFDLGFSEVARGRLARVRSIRPVTDCLEGQSMSMTFSDRQGDVGTKKDASPLRASGRMPIRGRGRYQRLKWTIAAGSRWNYAQGFELEYEAGGVR